MSHRQQPHEKLRRYAGAMVSTSLGSVDSFSMKSPTRTHPSTKPARYSTQQDEASSPSTSDLSLDELIDQFRASASSISQRQQREVQSPSPNRTGRRHLQATKSRRPSSDSDSDDGGRNGVAVSPMPKLNHMPKPKPSLQIPAIKRIPVAPAITKPVRDLPRSPSRKDPLPLTKRSKLASPKKINRQPPTRKPPSPSSLSNQSTDSSILDDIDPPDSDTPPEEASLDDLIGQDLRKLQSLVRRSHSKLSPLKLEPQDPAASDDHATSPRRSSFRIYSPARADRPGSSFRMRPVDSILHRHESHHRDRLHLAVDDDHDSFADELRAMKAAHEKEKKAAEKDAQDKQRDKEDDAKKKKESEEPGANVGSLREAVDVIDKTLLLALRPFEQMRQAMEKEDAKVAAAEEKADAALELPMATQSIVEQLEQAFGGQTRQRQAEMKAEEDAAAATKAAEEAKMKEEDEKKAADELARKLETEKMLELIPLRGRLLTTEANVHDTLLRLELAETLAREEASRLRQGPSSDAVEQQLQALREYADRRGQEIERGEAWIAPRAIDWHRSTFHLDRDNNTATAATNEPAVPEITGEYAPFPDVVKKEVLEQLDLTILKLRHALSVDEKEAQEAELARKQAAQEEQKKKQLEEDELRKRLQMEADTAAARQRVMGLASLDELEWVNETDTLLRGSVRRDLATQRLENSFAAAYDHEETTALPSFFDTNARMAAKRFDSIRTLMEAPFVAKLRVDSESDRYHYRPRPVPSPQSPSRGRTHQPTEKVGQSTWLNRDNQRHEEDAVERRATSVHIQPRQLSPRRGHDSNQYDHHVSRRSRRPVIVVSPPSRTARRHYASAPLQQSMLLIQQLQADRREKTQWFHAATRHR